MHNAFPKLKIVLEHATTRAAVDTVRSLGSTIACTITHIKMTATTLVEDEICTLRDAV